MNQLHAENIGKRFGRRVLFRKLRLEASPGRMLAITGSNGSGKSTLIRILAGVMRPTKGKIKVEVNGRLLEDEERPMHVGLVAPYLNVYDAFSPRENLRFIAKTRRMKQYGEQIDAVLDAVHLLDRGDDPVGTFSSGMKQRIRFASAIFSDPSILLLDEPSANLDIAGVGMVQDLIQDALARERIVIVATNDPAEAEACDDHVCVEDFRQGLRRNTLKR